MLNKIKLGGLIISLFFVIAYDASGQTCDYSVTSLSADKTFFYPQDGETVTFTADVVAPPTSTYQLFFKIEDACMHRGHWTSFMQGNAAASFTWTGNFADWCAGELLEIGPPGIYPVFIEPYDDYNNCYRSTPSSIYITICGEDTDDDGDGYAEPFWACWRPGNWDCNDSDATVYPGALETCDDIDNNCDGEIDEGLSSDSDQDGHYSYGSCKTPNDDCNDGDASVYPGAAEICDGKDNNCDGQADEGLSTDADGDLHYTYDSCMTPNDDCNDNDAVIYPAAAEICDDKDNNCNGETDEDTDPCCKDACCDNPTCDDEDDDDPNGPEEPEDVCDGYVGDPVSLFTGAETFTRTDLTVGRLYPITIDRRYNSRSKYDSQLGYGWAFSFDKRIYTYPDGSVTLRKECGWKRRFSPSADGFITPAGETGTLAKNPDGSFTYTRKNGKKENYDIYGRLASVIDANGNSMVFTYEAASRHPLVGLLLSNMDQTNPLIVSYDYRISKIEEKNASGTSTGNWVSFTYDFSTGRLILIMDSAGRTYTYDHDSIGNLTAVTGPGVSATYSYSIPVGPHRLTSFDEGKGLFTNVYDGNGRVSQQIHGEGLIDIEYLIPYERTRVTTTIKDSAGTVLNTVSRTVEFDAHGQVVKNTYSLESGNVTVYVRNSNGWITREEYWENVTTGSGTYLVLKRANNYTYDAVGNMLTSTEAAGSGLDKTTTYTYHPVFSKITSETVKSVVSTWQNRVKTYSYDDTNGYLLSTTETGFLGSGSTYSYTTSYTYDSNGQVTAIYGPRTDVQDVITYTYDPITGYLTSMTRPVVGTTTFSDHDALGNPRTVTDPNGNTTIYTYDAAGRVTSVKAPGDTSAAQYAYLSGGCISCGSGGTNKLDYIILPEGNKIDYDYDAYGNLIVIKDNAGNSIHYTYDTKGNKLTEDVKDAGGTLQKTLGFQYDVFSRLTQIQFPDASYTEYAYDIHGNRLNAKDQNGNWTAYQYDVLNRLISMVQPGNITTSYIYDWNNNLVIVQGDNETSTAHFHDDRNRIYHIGSSDIGTIMYEFDPAGNPISKADDRGVMITYQYDASNRLTKIDFPTDADILYTYDACLNGKGKLCSMTDAGGATNYEYSKKGQITKETRVIDGTTYVTQYTYDQNGNPKTMTYPSGRVITYTYSNDRAVTVLNNAANLATNIGYKPFGPMNAVTYGNGIISSVNYDNQYHIAAMQAGTVANLTYTDDANGNITGIANNLDPAKNRTYSYDALERLTNAIGPWGTRGWTYDGVGNRLTENIDNDTNPYSYFGITNKIEKISAGRNSHTFTYDWAGNMLTDNKITYAYNDNQRLVSVEDGRTTVGQYVYNGSGQRVKKIANGLTTIYHYNLRGQLIAESDSAGTITAEYVYLNGQPLAKLEGPDTYYYHNDHLATPQKMTDASGVVVWAADYKPFGEATVTVSTITNNLRFPGEYFDQETGLLYNYFRDRNPAIGRYLEADPIGLLGGINPYRWVKNNPIGFIDPLGLVSPADQAVITTTTDLIVDGLSTGLSVAGDVIAAGVGAVGLILGNPTSTALDDGEIIIDGRSYSKGGNQNQRDTGLEGQTDQEIQDAYDKASGKEKKRLEKELKARKQKNKQKRCQ